jgi:general secretion pathway protein G
MKTPEKNLLIKLRVNNGFTLVEMLLVLVILSALAAIVYPNLARHAREARIVATKSQIQVFRTALRSFEMDNDHYPSGRNGLLDLVRRPSDARNWHGPYLEQGIIPKDQWGHDFIYITPTPTISAQRDQMVLLEPRTTSQAGNQTIRTSRSCRFPARVQPSTTRVVQAAAFFAVTPAAFRRPSWLSNWPMRESNSSTWKGLLT